MKFFKNGDIIKISDSTEFLVASSVIYSGGNFLYLVDINDNKTQYIGEAIQDELGVKIDYLDGTADENKKIVKDLVGLFYNDVKHFLEKENNNAL